MLADVIPIEFEHIAIAFHVDDLLAWDRLLRAELGGEASLGGVVPANDFQGGQITYAGGGMLELLTWVGGADSKSAMQRYVEKQGGRGAVHHLTFLIGDFEEAVERCRALGYEPMIGRNGRNWREFFVRDPGLRPKGMLIQVLQANKQALISESGWDADWEPFAAEYPEVRTPVRIAGIQLASVDPTASRRLFEELLAAEAEEGTDGPVLRWPASSMRVRLVESADPADTFIEIHAPGDSGPAELTSSIGAGEHPESASGLLRPIEAPPA